MRQCLWHSWQSGSNPFIGKILLDVYLLFTVWRKDENKEKEAGNGPFFPKWWSKVHCKNRKKLWHFLAHKLWQNICLIGPIITDDHNVCLSLSVEYEIGVRSGTWYFLQSLFYALSKMGWSSSRPKTFLQCPIFRKVKLLTNLHTFVDKVIESSKSLLRLRPKLAEDTTSKKRFSNG